MYYGAGGANRVRKAVRTDKFGVADSTTYTYNNDGAVTGRTTYNGSGTQLSEDHLSYSYRDLLRKYVVGAITGMTRKDWRYRYSVSGEREGKRMYFNAGTDTSGRIHPWVYYLLGAGDEQLAIYHGQQTRDPLCSEGGRRVYIYPAEYHTRGPNDETNVITRPSGEKQYVIGDHLGSARSVYSSYGSVWGQYDYTPFGEKSGGTTPHNSYIDHERDGESSLLDFGVRKFDPITGRFLTVDPLMGLYPGESPYGYGGNNPLLYKDPSGMGWVTITKLGTPLEAGWTHREYIMPPPAGFSGSGPQGPAGIIHVPGANNGGGDEPNFFEQLINIGGEFTYGFFSALVDDAFGQKSPGLSGNPYLFGRMLGHGVGFVGSGMAMTEGGGLMVGGGMTTEFGIGVFGIGAGWALAGAGANWGINAAGNMGTDATSLINNYSQGASSSGGGSNIPQEAVNTLNHVENNNGAPPSGQVGGRTFKNSEGRLPAGGDYREYDIHPYQKGVNRGSERIVRDVKTGKAWYTSDHYLTFIPMN